MNVLLASLTGFVAGAGHVLAGPDHLAAVAPLAADQGRGTWRVGLMWGVGHSSGTWLIALLALLFRDALPVEALSHWGERLVGVALIVIGLMGLRRLAATRVHTHVHEHDGVRHAHIHVHKQAIGDAHPDGHQHSHSALGIGTLHGLAGSSHLLVVLPALLLPTNTDAVAYVACFGVGSVFAMTAFAWAMGVIAHRARRVGDRMFRAVLGGMSYVTIGVGCYWSVHATLWTS